MKRIKRMELHPAYIAGVLDSDGSLSIVIRHKKRPNPSYVPCFQLTWTYTEHSEKVMRSLQEKYGGSVYLPNILGTRYPNSRPTIKYFLVSRKLKKFLEDILPYIQLKKEQAQNILHLITTTKVGEYGNYRPKPQDLKDLHHRLYLRNKELNTKNSGDRRKYESN